MKPPSRQRVAPQRFVSKLSEPKRRSRVRTGWCDWSRAEKRYLLAGLKKHSSNSEIDLKALKAKLPKRSIQEISSFVQFLKARVGKRVARRVTLQSQEERKALVPIQLWTELAQDMAGSLEDAISSAFSQMLVIAATEPDCLLNSDPPHSLHCAQPLQPNLQSVHPRPFIRSPAVPLNKVALSSHIHKGPASTLFASGATPNGEGPLLATGRLASPVTVSKLSSSPSSPDPANPMGTSKKDSVCVSSPKSPLSNLPHTNIHQSNRKLGVTARPEQTTSQRVRHSSSSAHQGPSTVQQTSQMPLRQKEYVVDFENIYRFLNAVNKEGKKPCLTDMESAVVLDLLLSLPEELPQLDCEELQHHLCQVYLRLTAVAEGRRAAGRRARATLSQIVTERAGAPVQAEGPAGKGKRAEPPQSSGKSDCTLLENRAASCLGGEGADTFFQNSGNQGNGTGETATVRGTEGTESSGQTQASTTTAVLGYTKADGQNQTVEGRNLPPASQEVVGEKPDWGGAGLCPLNPFLVPLKLLAKPEA